MEQMGTQRQYPPEMKARAARVVFEWREVRGRSEGGPERSPSAGARAPRPLPLRSPPGVASASEPAGRAAELLPAQP
jgi:hypothetical protein